MAYSSKNHPREWKCNPVNLEGYHFSSTGIVELVVSGLLEKNNEEEKLLATMCFHKHEN